MRKAILRMFRRTSECFAACLLYAFAAQANDGAVHGTGGTWQFLRGEHRSVQMVREKIAMTVQPDTGAEVVADFWFHNHGPAVTVTMGFPENTDGVDAGGDYFRKHSDFEQFRSWVDGRRVAVRRVVTHAANETGRALWIKKVRFGRHQRHRIRVRYVTGGGADSSGYRSHEYSFTGGNWQGKVRDSLLTVKFLARGAWWVSGKGWRGNRLKYHRRNWQAQEEFDFSFISTIPSGGTDRGEFQGDDSWHYIKNSGYQLDRGIIYASRLPSIVQEGRHRWIQADKLRKFPFLEVRHNEDTENWELKNGKRRIIVKYREAVPNSARAPHRPELPFYVMRMGWPQLYLPLEKLKSALGIEFDNKGEVFPYRPKMARK